MTRLYYFYIGLVVLCKYFFQRFCHNIILFLIPKHNRVSSKSNCTHLFLHKIVLIFLKLNQLTINQEKEKEFLEPPREDWVKSNNVCLISGTKLLQKGLLTLEGKLSEK